MLLHKIAHDVLRGHILDSIKQLSNEEIVQDILLIQQLGEIETVHMIKVHKRDSIEAMTVVHQWHCYTMKDIVRLGIRHRSISTTCKKIMVAKYFRLQKLFIQQRIVFDDGFHHKLKLANGVYKDIHYISSREFRTIFKGKEKITCSKFCENLDVHSQAEYLRQIKGLRKHKA